LAAIVAGCVAALKYQVWRVEMDNETGRMKDLQ
jgi:hypothetical protein